MKKKFLCLMLAICLIIPCAITLVACGKNKGGGKLEAWEISKAEWQDVISTNKFTIRLNTKDMDSVENNTMTYFYYGYNGYSDNEIKYVQSTKYSFRDSGVYTTRYKKVRSTADDEYYYYTSTDSPNGQIQDYQTSNESSFNSNLERYFNLINYIADYDRFTNVGIAYESTNIPGLAPGNGNNRIDSVHVQKSDGKIDATYSAGGLEWTIDFESPLSMVANKTKNTKYYVKGGISPTDADYSEYYVNQSAQSGVVGLKVYTPNNPVANRKEAYYKKNESSYSLYTKLDNGEWQITESSYSEMSTVIDYVTTIYFPFLSTSINEFRLTSSEGSGYFTKNRTYELIDKEKVLTNENGLLTYKYYDIVITTSSNGIEKMTWKMKISQGNVELQEYSMELGFLTEEIVLPESANQ